MIRKYVKKPVRVEAALFNGSDDSAREIELWSEHKVIWHAEPPYDETHNYLTVDTLEGVMRVEKGDYVIKGTQGEFYPCKPAPFRDTYMRVLL